MTGRQMMCFVVSLEDGGLLSESSSLSGTGASARYGRQGPSMISTLGCGAARPDGASAGTMRH